jgi:hypothetical protein
MPLSYQLVEIAIAGGIIGFALLVASFCVGMFGCVLYFAFGW